MKWKQLSIDGKIYTNSREIDKILKSQEFYWLIDSEIEEAIIEIKKGTIIWHDGNLYSGNWKWGIFKSGNFWGNWQNGIWEGGNFYGKWVSGVKLENQSFDIKK